MSDAPKPKYNTDRMQAAHDRFRDAPTTLTDDDIAMLELVNRGPRAEAVRRGEEDPFYARFSDEYLQQAATNHFGWMFLDSTAFVTRTLRVRVREQAEHISELERRLRRLEDERMLGPS